MLEGKNREVLAPVATQTTSKSIPGDSYRLLCLVEGEAPIFEVTVPSDNDIYDLKELIHEKGIGAERAILAKDLKLLKVNLDIESYDKDSLNKIAIKPADNGVEDLKDLKRVSYYWPDDPPIDGRLHVFVKLPDFDTRPAKRRRSLSPPPNPSLNNPLVSPRKNTVSLLYQRLNKYGFIQVRGTSATGKTVLAKLLRQHIYKQKEDIDVFFIHLWPCNLVGGHEPYLMSLGWVPGKKTVFIFDNAQTTYSDEELWLGLFKSLEGHGPSRAIVFTRYGSPNMRIHLEATGTPIHLKPSQRVSLNPVLQDDDGLESVGLFLTQDEFEDLIHRRYPSPDHYFDLSFLNEVLKVTVGHVGAVLDFTSIIAAHGSYRSLKDSGQPYTWELFLKKVGPRELLARLDSSASVFTRGLPADSDLQDLATVGVFSAVLCQNVVTQSDFTSEDALQHCFRKGWLHAEKLDSINVGYVFATPLHRWFVEWKLFEYSQEVSLEGTNILEFVVNVIRNFSHQVLSAERRMGPGCIQRPAEAQYQDEFYRCCRECSKGSLLTFPEYGTAKGRADFYIPAKKWGVELLSDGDRLEEHSGRFSQSGTYQTSLPLSDYIILDCRKTRPMLSHSNFQKLYHVVFDDDFRNVSILDNMLKPVDGGEFLLSSS